VGTQARYRYMELAEQLLGRIEDGTFRVGDRLPSVRELKQQTGFSTATVCRALEEVERRGLAEARPRSGYFVLARSKPYFEVPMVSRRVQKPRPATVHALTESMVRGTGQTRLVPFGGAALSPELVPAVQLTRIAREVLAADSRVLFRYSEPAGLMELRRELAKRMLAARVDCSPEQIVVSAGCMDAIRLCLTAVCGPGDVVAVETPTFFGFLQLARDMRMSIIELPTDPTTGLDLDALERSLNRYPIKALLVTPSFQNPTGALMPEQNRRRLAALAGKHELAVIESDVYGELPFNGQRQPPVAAYDEQGWVMYCSSLSKSLAAGLRVGWTAPGRFLEPVRHLKLSTSICSPSFNQLVIREFLQSGGFDRHLRRLRGSLMRNMSATLDAMRRHLPAEIRVSDPRGGFLLWAELPATVKSDALYHAAKDAGVSVLPGAICASNRRFDSAIRINCGYRWNERMENGMRSLGQLCSRLSAAAREGS
jgi:DNA-binding transcriptional MocR family regulator